jgi:hypothetical protein
VLALRPSAKASGYSQSGKGRQFGCVASIGLPNHEITIRRAPLAHGIVPKSSVGLAMKKSVIGIDEPGAGPLAQVVPEEFLCNVDSPFTHFSPMPLLNFDALTLAQCMPLTFHR